MRFSSLLLTLFVGVLALSPLDAVSASTDCSERFQVGSYGVPADEPAISAGALAVSGFAPMYLEKRRVAVSSPIDCRYVTSYDVFRLISGQGSGLLAGCYGDFDGDGRRDYALLLREIGDTSVIAYVFLSRPPRYLAIALGGVTDPYGFNQDPSAWPGPFCQTRPKNGRFKALDDEISVLGDIIQVGWYVYYWMPAERRFRNALVED